MKAASAGEPTLATVVVFPPMEFNPFADTTSLPSVSVAAEASAGSARASVTLARPNWDALPPDVMGIIIDLAAANATRDYIALTAVSKAWRRARRKGPQGRRIESLEIAFHEEKSFAKRSEVQRKQLMARARGLRRRQKCDTLVITIILLVYGLGCIIGGALGFHYFFASVSSADVSLAGFNCSQNVTQINANLNLTNIDQNQTNLIAANQNFTSLNASVCSCVAGQSEPLRTTSFVLSFFWLWYGLGILLMCALAIADLCPNVVALSESLLMVIFTVGCFVFVIAYISMIAFVPAWYYMLGGLRRECIDDGYYTRFYMFLSAFTACEALNIAMFFLIICASFCS